MKHHKALLVVLFTFISFLTFSQQKKDLTGDWTILKVIMPAELKKQAKGNIKEMEDVLLKTKFHFKNNENCVIDSPQKGMQCNNCKWIYNPNDKSITVKESDIKSKGMILKLFAKSDNNKWFFSIYETPIVLEVQKM